MRHRANTSVAPYCYLFDSAYNGVQRRDCSERADDADAVVKTTFGLLDLQFRVPLSHSP